MYAIWEMWFEGSFMICCSVAGHSVWEIIATSCSISLWPAECCHKNCLAERLDNDELGVWYYCHVYPLIFVFLCIGDSIIVDLPWPMDSLRAPLMANQLSPIITLCARLNLGLSAYGIAVLVDHNRLALSCMILL